jgi:enoyl-CoA hydratase/carnithine racemase
MDAGENRFSESNCADLNRALDEVEGVEAPVALVTTGAGKMYSNGLDLDEMMRAGTGGADAHLGRVLELLARVLTFPAVTVAAVNGHAFGAGALFAAAQDFRVMRADRGYFCMPEIDLRVPLHPFMTALLKARLPGSAVHQAIVTGTRFGGREAAACGIVEQAVSEEELLPAAIRIAEPLTVKAHAVMRRLKRDLYAPVLEALATPLSAVAG